MEKHFSNCLPVHPHTHTSGVYCLLFLLCCINKPCPPHPLPTRPLKPRRRVGSSEQDFETISLSFQKNQLLPYKPMSCGASHTHTHTGIFPLPQQITALPFRCQNEPQQLCMCTRCWHTKRLGSFETTVLFYASINYAMAIKQSPAERERNRQRERNRERERWYPNLRGYTQTRAEHFDGHDSYYLLPAEVGEVRMGLDGIWQPTSWRYAHLNVARAHTHTFSTQRFPLQHLCCRLSSYAQMSKASFVSAGPRLPSGRPFLH